MKETIYSALQIILAIVLIVIILVQQKGSGVGGIFGGSGNTYSTKRGVDKILHYITIVSACLFFGVSALRLL